MMNRGWKSFLLVLLSVPTWAAESERLPQHLQKEHLQQERLQIVASIRPLALMVRDLAGDAAHVEVLLAGKASPHHYNLRVSDLQTLQAADLLVWLGPKFERFLAPLAAQRKEEGLLTLSSLPQWTETKGPEAKDLHLWLDPDKGRVMLRAIAERLSQLQPQQAEVFAANLARTEAELNRVTNTVAHQLAPLAGRGFGVSHDGFGHFVTHFGLNQLAAVSVMPDQGLSARHIAETIQQLQGAHCLIVEAGEPEASVARLEQLLDLPAVQADPLALNPAIDSYPALIGELGRSFAECLK